MSPVFPPSHVSIRKRPHTFTNAGCCGDQLESARDLPSALQDPRVSHAAVWAAAAANVGAHEASDTCHLSPKWDSTAANSESEPPKGALDPKKPHRRTS